MAILLFGPVPPGAQGSYITIPAGIYPMGQDGSADSSYTDEVPIHWVSVDEFQISEYEITNSEFAAFLNAVGTNQDADGRQYLDETDPSVRISWNGSVWTADAGWENHPVVEVSWYGADAFCRWAGGRLPSEEEWEKAAGWDASTSHQRSWPWGDSYTYPPCPDPPLSAMWWCISPRRTYPVGSFPAGVSPYNLYDMAGNVWEWTMGGYGSYPGCPLGSFADPTREVQRGGSWTNSTYNHHTFTRSPQPPYITDANLGFRVVMSSSEPPVMSLPEPNVSPPQVWEENFNSPVTMDETRLWWGTGQSYSVDTGNGWFVSSLNGATDPNGEGMGIFRRDLSAWFSPGDVVDISVRLRYDRGDRDFARTSVAFSWGDGRTIVPGGRGADENTGYPWYLLANNSDAPNTWHTVKAERITWGTGKFCLGFGLWGNLTNEASPPIIDEFRQYVDWIRVEHSAAATPVPTPTFGPSPTPTETPVPPDCSPILRRGEAGGGVQLYVAASDVSDMRDDRGGGPAVDIEGTSVGGSSSPWAPSGSDLSPGYLDGTQCGTTGEVRDAIGFCNSNDRLSPGSNLALTKPDLSGAGIAYNLGNYVSPISGADPRTPCDEISPSYPSWVKFCVRDPDLLGITKVYVWFRAFKPVLQSNSGESTFDDDSYWIVGSPEHSVIDRSLFYLADDNDGPGDNDGPDRSGATAQLFNNCGEAGRGMGQWFWGNTRVDGTTDLAADWCGNTTNKVTTEGNRVTVLYTTVTDDGMGNGNVQFYIVGREAETLAEAIQMDIVCISTVGPPSFVPSDDAWEIAGPAAVGLWRVY